MAEARSSFDKARETAKSLGGKAKETGKTYGGKARETGKTFADKAWETTKSLTGKARRTLGSKAPKLDSAVDKTTGFVDEKTKHKYSDKIEKVQKVAHDAVHKVADDGGGAAQKATGKAKEAKETAEKAKPGSKPGS